MLELIVGVVGVGWLDSWWTRDNTQDDIVFVVLVACAGSTLVVASGDEISVPEGGRENTYYAFSDS